MTTKMNKDRVAKFIPDKRKRSKVRLLTRREIETLPANCVVGTMELLNPPEPIRKPAKKRRRG